MDDDLGAQIDVVGEEQQDERACSLFSKPWHQQTVISVGLPLLSQCSNLLSHRWILQCVRDKACVDCGRRDLLHFDHVPEYEKTGHTITGELELRCAPCPHQRSSDPTGRA